MKRFFIAVVIVFLVCMIYAPRPAQAGWKIYYTGEAAQMFGSEGRGDFATRAEAEAYWNSQPSFEKSNSYVNGFDDASSGSQEDSSNQALLEEEGNRLMQNFGMEGSYQPITVNAPPPTDVSTGQVAPPAVNQAVSIQQGGGLQRRRQNTTQIQQTQTAQQQASQNQFDEAKIELLQNLKGSTSGTLGLKTGTQPSVYISNSTVSVVQMEQNKFEQNPAAWSEKETKLIQERLKGQNKQCQGIQSRLMGKVDPLPDKKFNELQAGDVLLIAGSGLITGTDNLLSGDKVSFASHTVLYLKEVNGKKLFLDNQPFGKSGPRIISEDEFLETYGHRNADVARLVGQPLNDKEAKQLFSAAVKMAQDNRKVVANNWFGTTMFGTNFGAWGKDDIVCSEADWLLLKSTGRQIPRSSDNVKVKLGIDFSPADYQNGRYFLVTPLDMPEKNKR